MTDKATNPAPRTAARKPQLWAKRDQAAVCVYVRDVADLIGLRDWTFHVRFDDAAGDGMIAQIAPTPGQREAVLMLSDLFAWSDPEFQRATICHELVHCVLAPITESYGAALIEATDQATADIVDEAVSPAVEVATDTLALAIAERAPLPSFATPKVARPEPDPRSTTVPPRSQR